jgi:hypothetical protein
MAVTEVAMAEMASAEMAMAEMAAVAAEVMTAAVEATAAAMKAAGFRRNGGSGRSQRDDDKSKFTQHSSDSMFVMHLASLQCCDVMAARIAGAVREVTLKC